MKIKEIQIRRRETMSHLPPPIVADTKKILSSVYVGQGPLKGLAGEEEKELLSTYLGMDKDDKGFSHVCRSFWADLRVNVPSEGKVLNISVREDGTPVEVFDYIIYKWATKHKYVANSRKDLLNHSSTEKRFYIYDPDAEEMSQNKIVAVKKKAYQELIKMSDNEDKMDMVITVLSEGDPGNMNKTQKENYLDQLLSENPSKFVKIVTDKSLEIKSLISELVSLGIITQLSNQYWFHDQKLGDTLEYTVLYFKDKKNSSTTNLLKAKLQEAKKTT